MVYVPCVSSSIVRTAVHRVSSLRLIEGGADTRVCVDYQPTLNAVLKMYMFIYISRYSPWALNCRLFVYCIYMFRVHVSNCSLATEGIYPYRRVDGNIHCLHMCLMTDIAFIYLRRESLLLGRRLTVS
jgi:hypothetical protein